MVLENARALRGPPGAVGRGSGTQRWPRSAEGAAGGRGPDGRWPKIQIHNLTLWPFAIWLSDRVRRGGREARSTRRRMQDVERGHEVARFGRAGPRGPIVRRWNVRPNSPMPQDGAGEDARDLVKSGLGFHVRRLCGIHSAAWAQRHRALLPEMLTVTVRGGRGDRGSVAGL